VCQDAVEPIRKMPGDGEGRDATRAEASNRPVIGIGADVVVSNDDVACDLVRHKAPVFVGHRVVFVRAVLGWIDEEAKRHWHVAAGDEVVEYDRGLEVGLQVKAEVVFATVLKHHEASRLGGVVLRGHIQPVIEGVTIDSAEVPSLKQAAARNVGFDKGVGRAIVRWYLRVNPIVGILGLCWLRWVLEGKVDHRRWPVLR